MDLYPLNPTKTWQGEGREHERIQMLVLLHFFLMNVNAGLDAYLQAVALFDHSILDIARFPLKNDKRGAFLVQAMAAALLILERDEAFFWKKSSAEYTEEWFAHSVQQEPLPVRVEASLLQHKAMAYLQYVMEVMVRAPGWSVSLEELQWYMDSIAQCFSAMLAPGCCCSPLVAWRHRTVVVTTCQGEQVPVPPATWHAMLLLLTTLSGEYSTAEQVQIGLDVLARRHDARSLAFIMRAQRMLLHATTTDFDDAWTFVHMFIDTMEAGDTTVYGKSCPQPC